MGQAQISLVLSPFAQIQQMRINADEHIICEIGVESERKLHQSHNGDNYFHMHLLHAFSKFYKNYFFAG